MDQLRVIIIDDVRLIRVELRTMLSEYPEVEVVGEAGNVADALPLISELKPDLVFLDIRLPDLSGFDLLDKTEADFKVIFISSYDKYIPKARTYNPVDFLLKPINKKKLYKAIQKVLDAMAVK